jgi:RsiW-degrading membrane proteinase PrsW (M82 family)
VRYLAGALTAWTAWRWLGFFLGLVRLRKFEGQARREARRTVIGRGAWNVFFSVALVYLWASIYDQQPGETFVGFLAAMMMCSLAIGIIAGFMQPEKRTPETIDVCRVW